MDRNNITTAFELPGMKIKKNLGIIRGIVVRSRSIIGSFAAGIQTIFGGNITLYSELCEIARKEAFDVLVKHATAKGADGIIGMRYDATEIAPGVTEVLAYGTAVTLKKGR